MARRVASDHHRSHAATLVNCAPRGEMHNYCTPHIIKENFENFFIHQCNYILLSQVYCVWQVVKTPTIIFNNPVHASTSFSEFFTKMFDCLGWDHRVFSKRRAPNIQWHSVKSRTSRCLTQHWFELCCSIWHSISAIWIVWFTFVIRLYFIFTSQLLPLWNRLSGISEVWPSDTHNAVRRKQVVLVNYISYTN